MQIKKRHHFLNKIIIIIMDRLYLCHLFLIIEGVSMLLLVWFVSFYLSHGKSNLCGLIKAKTIL